MSRFKTWLTSMLLLIAVCCVLSGCVHQKQQHYQHIYCSAKHDYAVGLYHEAFNKVVYLAYRGHTPAQYALGRMYYYGTGIVQDIDQGRLWIRIAAMKNYLPAIEAISLIHDSTSPQYTTLEPGLNGRRWAQSDPAMPGSPAKSQFAQQEKSQTVVQASAPQLTAKKGKQSLFSSQLGANQVQHPAKIDKRTLMGMETPQRTMRPGYYDMRNKTNSVLPQHVTHQVARQTLPDDLQLANQTENVENYHVTLRRFTALPNDNVTTKQAQQTVVAHNTKQQRMNKVKAYLHQRAIARRKLSNSSEYLTQTYRQAQQKLQPQMQLSHESPVANQHHQQHAQHLAHQITQHHIKNRTSVHEWNRKHYSHKDNATNRKIHQEILEGKFDLRQSHRHAQHTKHAKRNLPIPEVLERNSEFLHHHVVPLPHAQASASSYSKNDEINL